MSASRCRSSAFVASWSSSRCACVRRRVERLWINATGVLDGVNAVFSADLLALKGYWSMVNDESNTH